MELHQINQMLYYHAFVTIIEHKIISAQNLFTELKNFGQQFFSHDEEKKLDDIILTVLEDLILDIYLEATRVINMNLALDANNKISLQFAWTEKTEI